MKTVLAALIMSVLSLGSATAVEYRTPVTKQLFTCAAHSVLRISTGSVALPGFAPCCDGQLKCAQFLSTTGIHKMLRDPRT
jgi:hypothetical protein